MLNLKTEILQHYKGYESLISQLEDGICHYERTGLNTALNFMTPDQREAVCRYIGSRIPYRFLNGDENNDKSRLVLGDEIEESDYICCLRAKFNPKFRKISHRDVLGALYGLQIDINRFGDLWVADDWIYLYCENEIADSVIFSFDKVANLNIHFERCDFVGQVRHFETKNAHVSSLRLDTVVSEIIRKSREKAKVYIQQSNASVNYKTIEDCAFLCNNDDILSLRGYGRYQIDEIRLNNRSGNYLLIIKKFV